METSRRSFLRSTLALGAAAGLRPALAVTPPAASARQGPRGLLFDEEDLPRIRAHLDRAEFAELKTWFHGVDFAADERFLRHELSLKNKIQHMSRAQGILCRSMFVHRLSPDPRHLALCRLALRRVLDYQPWDWLLEGPSLPVSVMRGAGTCVALALAAEWLAADLTPDEQEEITRRLAQDGAPPCARGIYGMDHPDRVAPWQLVPGEEGLPPMDVTRWPYILRDTNLRIICTAGLICAAAHLQGRDKEVPAWVELARNSLVNYGREHIAADGSFGEGISYWNYTFVHYFLSLEVLRRRFSVDVSNAAPLQPMGRYAVEMTLPTVGQPLDCINLGDANVASGSVPFLWLAREYRDAGAQQASFTPKSHTLTWTSFLGLIWYDPSVPARPYENLRLDHRYALGYIVSRTGFATQDNVLVFRSGDPVNHEHGDRNSLLFKAHGERLLNDPLKASYSPADPRWLLRQTEAHTSLLIGGRGHFYHDGRDGTCASPAKARLIDYRVLAAGMIACSDATQPYQLAGLPIRRVLRTVVYLKPDVVVVCDQVTLDGALPIEARFQAFNDDRLATLHAEGATFTLLRPHASLRGTAASSRPVRIATRQLALPEASGVFPYVSASLEASPQHLLLTALTAAPAGQPHGELTWSEDTTGWTLRGSHRTQQVHLHFDLTGDAPAVVTLRAATPA
ncbi:MAG: heparinase II/III family protein [Opitutaceae bacterium]